MLSLPPINGETPETAMVVGKMLAENLIDSDPTDLRGIMSIMDRTIYGNTSIKSAIDIACHDLKAKSLKIPFMKCLMLSIKLGYKLHQKPLDP